MIKKIVITFLVCIMAVIFNGCPAPSLWDFFDADQENNNVHEENNNNETTAVNIDLDKDGIDDSIDPVVIYIDDDGIENTKVLPDSDDVKRLIPKSLFSEEFLQKISNTIDFSLDRKEPNYGISSATVYGEFSATPYTGDNPDDKPTINIRIKSLNPYSNWYQINHASFLEEINNKVEQSNKGAYEESKTKGQAVVSNNMPYLRKSVQEHFYYTAEHPLTHRENFHELMVIGECVIIEINYINMESGNIGKIYEPIWAIIKEEIDTFESNLNDYNGSKLVEAPWLTKQ